MAFTEFYCESGGSNMNGGSNSGATHFSQTNGNWSTVTNNFTVTNGHNPVSDGVVVGDFASVFIDGATTPVYIARVTAVQNATNGTITLSTTAKFGTAPTTSATARTINVGGAWKGPSGSTDFFPMNQSIQTLTNSNSERVRVNLKNDQTYSMTAAMSLTGGIQTYQGYGSAVGDAGKIVLTNSVAGIGFTGSGMQGVIYRNIIFVCTAASAANQLFFSSAGGIMFVNCVFHGARGSAYQCNGNTISIGCEYYDNNKSNTASVSTYRVGGGFHVLINSYIHDNTGSNGDGIGQSGSGGSLVLINSIIESNAGKGMNFATNASAIVAAVNSDFYNNTGDAFFFDATDASQINPVIINTNFIKNGGAAVNFPDNGAGGFASNNGYGSGTQANGADTLKSLALENPVAYASNVTPYSAPTTGNFSIVLAAAFNAGIGAFTETDGTNTGTVGYPDIGAAGHLDTSDTPGPRKTLAATFCG